MQEFAGKFLTHAVQLWKLTSDPELEGFVEWFIGELAAIQAENGNGYLVSQHSPPSTNCTHNSGAPEF
jgi:hypothetical protein